MARIDLSIVKLGGSVITDKDQPLHTNVEALNRLAASLSSIEVPIIIIHGGGSYGHYYAKKFGLSRKPSSVSGEGVMKTRAAMLELDMQIVKTLGKHGMNCYSIPPSTVIEGEDLTNQGLLLVRLLISKGMTPITYGDVLASDRGFYVMSGDRIMRILANALKPQIAVFAMDVDGLYDSFDASGQLLERVHPNALSDITTPTHQVDVTGGIRNKLAEAFRISEEGVQVCFVNGLKPERVVKALIGKAFVGTVIEGKSPV